MVVNRLAHNLVREAPVLSAIRAAVASAPARARIHETRSLADLTAAVGRIEASGTDCVLLAGGDGSYLAGTTALFHAFGSALPTIGFLPGGTVCTVARNWGLRGGHAAYAGRLVRAALAGRAVVTRRPTLRVQDDRGGDRVGFIFGAGLVARFFDAYYEAPTQGYAAAAALVARVFAGAFTSGSLARRVLTPGPAKLLVNGQEQAPTAWSLIAASVVRDLGLHMLLLYRAPAATDGPPVFQVVASPLSPRRLSPQVGRVLLGRPLRGEGHVDALARELRVELTGHSGASTYVLDGDRIAAGTVTVTPGPVLRHASVTATGG